MTQVTYSHYPSFTRRYVRSVMKMMGLPKKPRIEAEVFDEMVYDEQVVHSINGEILILKCHHGHEGRVVVPEPSLSEWLQTVQLSRVQGDAWLWPWKITTLSFPTGQTFHGHPVDGALVARVDSTTPGPLRGFPERPRQPARRGHAGPWRPLADGHHPQPAGYPAESESDHTARRFQALADHRFHQP